MTDFELNKRAALLVCDLLDTSGGDRTSAARDRLKGLSFKDTIRVQGMALSEMTEAVQQVASDPVSQARLAVNIAQVRAEFA